MGLLAGDQEGESAGETGCGERVVDSVGAFAEMRPAAYVERHHDRSVEDGRCAGGVDAGQGQRLTVEEAGARRAGEEQGNVDGPEPLADLGDGVEGGVVAADVDGGKPGSVEHEPGDGPGERLATHGPVAGRHGGDGD